MVEMTGKARLFLNGSEERSCGAAGGGTETERKFRSLGNSGICWLVLVLDVIL
jgi:hypothetical protein